MLAVKYVPFAGDGVAVDEADVILANICVNVVGSQDLEITDAGNEENENILIAIIPAGSPKGVYQIERQVKAGIYLVNSNDWQGNIGLARGGAQ